MKNKKLIIIGLLVLFLIFYFVFIRNEEEVNEFTEVKRGNIVRTIFETGVLETKEEIILGSKVGGIIEKIYIKEGETVKKGDILSKINTNDLNLQLKINEENLKIAEITLNKMEKGARDQDVDIYRTKVESAEINLKQAENSLEKSKENLYFQIIDSYSKADDAIRNNIDQFFEHPRSKNTNFRVSFSLNGTNFYFPINQQTKRNINNQRLKIEENLENWEELTSQLEDNKLLSYTHKAELYLREIILFLDNISYEVNSFTAETPAAREILKGYRASISSARTLTNTALSTLINARTNFNSSIINFKTVEKGLKGAKEQLLLIKSPSRDEDIDIQKRNIEKIRLENKTIKQKIEDAKIIAPFNGRVAKINLNENEIVQPGVPLFSFVSQELNMVNANIYEGEIGYINIGEKVSVEIISFPEKKLTGKVSSISTKDKIVDGVVYYEVEIILNEIPENARLGMTSDITINTIQRKNVLLISELAINRREGEVFVNIIENGFLEERKIETGLRGDNRKIEIISGLKEGDKILVK